MKNHTRFTVRCTLAERAELEVKSGGDLSKYVRAVLFEDLSDGMLDLRARMEELTETVQVLNYSLAQTGEEVRELSSRQTCTGAEIREALAKAASAPQTQPTEAQALDNSVLKGMVLELLLLLRSTRSRTDLNSVQAEVERQKLPVWEDKPYVSSTTTSIAPKPQPQAVVEKREPQAGKAQKPAGLLDKIDKYFSK